MTLVICKGGGVHTPGGTCKKCQSAKSTTGGQIEFDQTEDTINPLKVPSNSRDEAIMRLEWPCNRCGKMALEKISKNAANADEPFIIIVRCTNCGSRKG